MSAHNTPANYMATSHAQSTNHATLSSGSESRIDKDYFLSVRGILKFLCLVSAYLYLLICVRNLFMKF